MSWERDLLHKNKLNAKRRVPSNQPVSVLCCALHHIGIEIVILICCLECRMRQTKHILERCCTSQRERDVRSRKRICRKWHSVVVSLARAAPEFYETLRERNLGEINFTKIYIYSHIMNLLLSTTNAQGMSQIQFPFNLKKMSIPVHVDLNYPQKYKSPTKSPNTSNPCHFRPHDRE